VSQAEEGIFMGKKEQVTYRVIEDFLTAKICRREAAELLGIRERSVSRIARRVEQKRFLGVVHGNRGRRSEKRLPEELKRGVMGLMQSRYFDFNMTHALEVLKSEHNLVVGYSTFRKWCREKQLVKRRKRRRSKVRRARVRMPSEGLLLQMDGSHHRYNGKDEWCLIAAIDDATSEIPYGEFFLGEDTLSCMAVMQKIIEKKGIPRAIYTDKAGIFGGKKRQNFSQFCRACEELDIQVICADSAQAKGRIERTWDTVQDRIIPEMRIRKIHRIKAANAYLQEQFLPGYWEQNNIVAPRNTESRYRKLSTKVNLREIFCIKEFRSVKADHTLSWDGEIYQIQSPLKYSIQGQKIEFRTYQDLTTKTYFAGKEIEIVKFNRPQALKQAA
jgi:transposase-like protein